jgi:outer membrane biosynthesis protein TonB
VISTKALLSLSPTATLALAVALSMLGHGVFLHGVKPHARAGANRPAPHERLSVRLMSARTASLSPVIFASAPPRQRDHRRENTVTAAPRAQAVESATVDATQRREEIVVPAIVAFEPALYLRPSDVDAVATPVSQEALELLQLSGEQPGLWVVRVYIGESGTVDELEVVDGRGSETNTLELLGLLRSVRFVPALAQGRPVRSQKMLEFSFEPGPVPLTPILVPSPAPSPSAAGK